MRQPIGQNDPSLLRRAFTPARPGDVHHVVVAEPTGIAGAQCLHGDPARILALNPAATSRRIFRVPQREEERGADCDPAEVQGQVPARARHSSYHNHPMTRPEMEQKLLEIVRKEKSLPIESLGSETQLADAGIDSLDALTILFAIEEEFKISIPDDRARAMKTFGDLSNAVAEQVGIT